MQASPNESGDLIFADDGGPDLGEIVAQPWRVLVVDDDAEIHRVTRLVLSAFVFKDRPIEIISAFSGLEARSLLASAPDISVILLDVVMETDDSGLRLVQFIRQQYRNRKTRIILRTGQPGYAPELRVLLDYDINDYRAKTELTAERLITAVAVSLRSYSDIEAAEIATARSQAAEEAVIAKSTFLANMSHELRTPLNAVIGNIELLRLTPLTPRQIDITESAATAARILMDVIGDVLDLSKLEADRFELDCVPTDLQVLLGEIEDVISPIVAAKKLSFRIHVSPDVPSDVITDPMRLRQILSNLLANAAKFTARGGVMLNARVSSRRNGVVIVRFEVCDSGIGFDPAKAAAIFEPFVQAESSMVRKYGGTGLGLAISKRAVEFLGGDIGCRSIVGAGSTFWCDVPFVAVHEAHWPMAPDARASVVVVGEAGDGAISRTLTQSGVRLTYLADPSSALLSFVATPGPSRPIVVTRWPSPVVDVLHLIAGEMPIVAIVGEDDDALVYEALRDGAGYVLRDDRLDELPAVIAGCGYGRFDLLEDSP